MMKPMGTQVKEIIRQDPSPRKEVVLLGKSLEHAHQVTRQVMFPSQDLDARIHVDFLVGKHLGEIICSNR
mgnify:CR=1 FL=1